MSIAWQSLIPKLASFSENRFHVPQKYRKYALALASITFLFGIILSLFAQPEIFNRIEIIPVILLLFTAIPLTIILNSVEFVLTARLIGQSVRFQSALEITVIGSAANMLPLPGSTLVRVTALTAAGAKLRQGVISTGLVALIWLGVAFTYAGCWLLASSRMLIGGVAVAIGIALLVLSFAAAVRIANHWRTPFLICANKLVLVIIDAVRIFLSAQALGIDALFGQASILTVSSVLGSAVSVVPAGLGVREVVAAAIGPAIALAASSAYLATSLNRLADLSVIMPVAAVLGWKIGKRDGEGSRTP